MFVEIKNKSVCYLSVLHVVNYSGKNKMKKRTAFWEWSYNPVYWCVGNVPDAICE